MSYKIGDRVKIRKDLTARERYNDFLVVEDMRKYRGRTAIIETVNKFASTSDPYYTLDIDTEKSYWTDSMLQPVHEYKVGDKVTVNSDLVVDKIYEGVVFTESMTKAFWEVCTIASVVKAYGCGYVYTLKENTGNPKWAFAECMLTPYHEQKYKVGEEVILRTDLVVGTRYSGITFVEEMKYFQGEPLKVKSYVGDEFTSPHYSLKKGVNTLCFGFSEEMLMPLPNKHKVGDRVRIISSPLSPSHPSIGNTHIIERVELVDENRDVWYSLCGTVTIHKESDLELAKPLYEKGQKVSVRKDLNENCEYNGISAITEILQLAEEPLTIDGVLTVADGSMRYTVEESCLILGENMLIIAKKIPTFKEGYNVKLKSSVRVGEEYNKIPIEEGMFKLRDKVFTICTPRVTENGEVVVYSVNENPYYWEESMLELVTPKYRVGQRVTVRTDLTENQAYSGIVAYRYVLARGGETYTILDYLVNKEGYFSYVVAECPCTFGESMLKLEEVTPASSPATLKKEIDNKKKDIAYLMSRVKSDRGKIDEFEKQLAEKTAELEKLLKGKDKYILTSNDKPSETGNWSPHVVMGTQKFDCKGTAEKAGKMCRLVKAVYAWKEVNDKEEVEWDKEKKHYYVYYNTKRGTVDCTCNDIYKSTVLYLSSEALAFKCYEDLKELWDDVLIPR